MQTKAHATASAHCPHYLYITCVPCMQFEEKHHSLLVKAIADELQCSPSAIVDFELNVCDTQPGVIGGNAADLCSKAVPALPCLSAVFNIDKVIRHPQLLDDVSSSISGQ